MILEQIQNDLKAAMFAKDTVKVETLRFLLAQIKNRQIDLQAQGKDLTDEDTTSVLQKQAKERRESMEAFQKAGRDDLFKVEEAQLAILSQYLPQQLTVEELEKIVQESIAETQAAGPADFGAVMKTAMGKVKGQADGNTVSALVRKYLG